MTGKLREFIKISGFLLIIVGTAGLLLNEFACHLALIAVTG